MKVYISADIEGVTGSTHWDETEKTKMDFSPFAIQMTKEVKAACEGSINAGATEIWIKDAHDSARNIDFSEFPINIKYIRGWSGHPYLMMQEIDNTFDAAILIGYHAHSGSGDNPLAHTLDASNVHYIKINGEFADEFLINTYTAWFEGVPVVFISGDEGVCNHASSINSNIKAVAVKKGVGNSTISIHPEVSVDRIRKEVEKALHEDLNKYKGELPEKFKVEISFVKHHKAYRASFYPGMKQLSPHVVEFEADNYFDILKMFNFVL
jgi:D-amino peptidase